MPTAAMQLLWICVAGGLGSGTRFLVGLLTHRWFGQAFPFGTLAVNVVGCFLIAVALQAGALTPTQRLVLATGFLGGFTTYSSFNYDALRFVSEGAIGKAVAYVVATVVGCAVAGVLGLWVAR
jgi:CrcB protein